MEKIIRSFENKKKTLSLEKEKKLLEIIAEEIKKVKSFHPDTPRIAQLKNEIQQLEKLIGETLEKEIKEKELRSLESKDIYRIYQELAEQLSPQSIEKHQKRKPTLLEKEKWEQIQKAYQKAGKVIRTLLDYSYNFVKYIERGYYYSGRTDYEDLTTEGVLSLLRAVEKFDPSYGRRLSTFSGYGIRQRIKTFIDKSQLLGKGSGSKGETKLTYYDSNYQSDKESNSYSLMETLNDDQASSLEAEENFQQDIKAQINQLLNSLESRETNWVIRSLYQINPINLFDVYCLATENEKVELKKAVKLGNKSKPELLQKYSLHEKKISQMEIVKKYSLGKGSESEIAQFLNLSKEKEVIRLKESGLKQLRKLAEEKNLGAFVI